MSDPILTARGLRKVYRMPAGDVVAVDDVALDLAAGESISIQGPSGCGKSTLLHLLGCVDEPTAGSLSIGGAAVSGLSDGELSRLRLMRIGFVFQRFFLLPMLTAQENIELPMYEAGTAAAERRRRSDELLRYVGLEQRGHHLPSQLSGGEMQRVAIARALANRPRVLLADEPTGELDEKTGDQVAALLERVHADGTAMIVVTHNAALARRAQRHLTMRSGRLQEAGA